MMSDKRFTWLMALAYFGFICLLFFTAVTCETNKLTVKLSICEAKCELYKEKCGGNDDPGEPSALPSAPPPHSVENTP